MEFTEFKTEIEELKSESVLFVVNNQVMTTTITSSTHIIFATKDKDATVYVIDEGSFIYKVDAGEYNLDTITTFTLKIYKQYQ